MNYIAEHIDPEKFESELMNHRKYQQELQRLGIEKVNSFYAGYTACLDEVSSMLHCSNYESTGKITSAYREGANNAFYELCKELGIGCQDIREKNISVDEKAERERDAAIQYMRKAFGWCTGCVHFTGIYGSGCKIGEMSTCGEENSRYVFQKEG